MTATNRFKKVKDNNGEEYLCNLEFVKNNTETNYADTEECFEADVAQRYASDIEVIR